jgi:hypothetical protein
MNILNVNLLVLRLHVFIALQWSNVSTPPYKQIEL